MRILKKKIAKANHVQSKPHPLTRSGYKYQQTGSTSIEGGFNIIKKSIKKIPDRTKTKRAQEILNLAEFGSISTKNIVKNYARAICNFIASDVSSEYIERYGDKLAQDEIQEFRDFISRNKDIVDCIERFKSMLLVSRYDSSKLKRFKHIFQKVGETFVKYFSVNWIFNGRLKQRKAHLAYRFKILRRIQNPHLFTHLTSFLKKEKESTDSSYHEENL